MVLTLVLSTTETRPGDLSEHLCHLPLGLQNLTVVVRLLEIHIDNTARPHLGHGITVQSLHLSESARSNFIAAVLSKEDGNGVVAELLGAVLVSRLRVGRVTTPRVDIVTPKVDGLIIGRAVKVVSQVITDRRDISSGVANTHGPVSLLLDILLHVAHRSLDESGRVRGGNGVGDLIAGEEANRVVVLGQLVDHAGVAGVQAREPGWVVAVNGLGWVREIGDQVDACIGQQLHTLRVVGTGVDRVGSDDVGAKLLENGNITLASGGIGQGVLVAGAVTCILWWTVMLVPKVHVEVLVWDDLAEFVNIR